MEIVGDDAVVAAGGDDGSHEVEATEDVRCGNGEGAGVGSGEGSSAMGDRDWPKWKEIQ